MKRLDPRVWFAAGGVLVVLIVSVAVELDRGTRGSSVVTSNFAVDFVRDQLGDYWDGLPLLAAVVVVALLVLGVQRLVRSSVRKELDRQDRGR